MMLRVLDFAGGEAQKQGKVRSLSPSFYAEWRSGTLAPPFRGEQERGSQLDLTGSLREISEHNLLTEHLLQVIWHHQRVRRDRLQTVQGWPLLVLHPGFWNREAGPDFRGAVIQLGAGPVVTGDVEIDLEPHGWRSHRHDLNPAYRQVILHVVWEASRTEATAIPTLAIKPFLDAPLRELKRWLGRHPKLAGAVLGQCCAPLKELPVAVLTELVRQAAMIRLQAKAAEFEARARHAGWEQSLWEGLFGGLGYKQNVWPMRRLAELLPAMLPETRSSSAISLQAHLLGLSGLLPADLSTARPSVQQYGRAIWDIWWRDREQYAEVILPRNLWKWNGIRPANHPHRRLALAAHWLASADMISRLEQWFATRIKDADLLGSLLEVLQVTGDDFWCWHWTMGSVRLRTAHPLIGPQRATDLAMNVLLPWFWMRAMAGKNEAFQACAEHRFFVWPKAEDNSVLRLARQRLFGSRRIALFKTAAAQQGLLQIVRDFCDHSNALCDDCQFPQLVKELGC